jgi:hypothetical protein
MIMNGMSFVVNVERRLVVERQRRRLLILGIKDLKINRSLPQFLVASKQRGNLSHPLKTAKKADGLAKWTNSQPTALTFATSQFYNETGCFNNH